MSTEKLRRAAPWIALSVLLLLPLYVLSTAFAIRSGVLDLGKRNITADEYKAMWAFFASGLATAATIIGLLLTKSHNDRTLAFQSEIENRKLLAGEETDKRLALDSVVKGLELLVADGEYAPKARIAGALGALVHLDHPVIAMRALSAAWDEGAVDNATACWLIGEVLSGDSEQASREASILLRRHASKLPRDTEGSSEWPLSIRYEWPLNVPADVRGRILLALADMLVSRDREWWGDGYIWAIGLLDEAYRRETYGPAIDLAAKMLGILLATNREQGLIGFGNEYKDLKEINRTLSGHEAEYRPIGESGKAIDRLEAWANKTAEPAESSEPTNSRA
jgi:hypothetical protein